MRFTVFLVFTLFALCAYGAQESCNITYGFSGNIKPYQWKSPDGKHRGLFIDLLDAIASEAGCSWSIKDSPAHKQVEMLKNGEISLIMFSKMFDYRDEEETDLLLLNTLDITYRYFLSRKDSPQIKDLNGLYGKTVSVTGNTSGRYFARLKDKYGLTVLNFDRVEDAIKSISEGKGDLGLFEPKIASNIIEDGGYSNLRMYGEPLAPAMFVFAMYKNDGGLYARLHTAVEKLKANGKYYGIIKKWSAEDGGFLKYYKIAAAGLGAAILVMLFIMLWNRSLHIQVANKTKKLCESNMENIRLREEAIINGRLAALGGMAVAVAHEINNPAGLIVHNMTYLSNFIKELCAAAGKEIKKPLKICSMDMASAAEEAEASAEIINESLVRIKETVDKLKGYGRARSNEYGNTDLRECAENAVKMSDYFVKQYTSSFRTDFTVKSAVIYGNPLRIEECIINLIQNSCLALGTKRDKIVCGIEDTGRTVRLYVSDEGRGMDEETLAKAGEAFFTTRPDTGGTGLGLSITARIMKEHNGYMEIKSEVNKGTTVSLYFPKV